MTDQQQQQQQPNSVNGNATLDVALSDNQARRSSGLVRFQNHRHATVDKDILESAASGAFDTAHHVHHHSMTFPPHESQSYGYHHNDSSHHHNLTGSHGNHGNSNHNRNHNSNRLHGSFLQQVSSSLFSFHPTSRGSTGGSIGQNASAHGVPSHSSHSGSYNKSNHERNRNGKQHDSIFADTTEIDIFDHSDTNIPTHKTSREGRGGGDSTTISGSSSDLARSFWGCFGRCRASSRNRRRKTSLRTQIMLPFGALSCFVLVFIMLLSIRTTFHARETVINVGIENIDAWAKRHLAHTAQYIGELSDQQLLHLEGILNLIGVLTQERFAGYPTVTNDSMVPFDNYLAKHNLLQNDSVQKNNTNVYPWKARELLPFPNETIPNVGLYDYVEHMVIPYRGYWYPLDANVGTANAMMVVNESITDTSTPTFRLIHRKVSDYAAPMLKAIYEQQVEIKSLDIHFVNDGHSGVTVSYPTRQTPVGPPTIPHEIVGCEWLRLPNPFDPSRPLMNQTQRGHCQTSPPTGLLQQAFCRDQALRPNEYVLDGPYKEEGEWMVRFGKAIFDVVTHEFIACTSISVHGTMQSYVNVELSNVRILQDANLEVLTLKWDDGSVIGNYGDSAMEASDEPTFFANLWPDNDKLLEQIKATSRGDLSSDHAHHDHDEFYGFTDLVNDWYVMAWPSPSRPVDATHEELQQWKPQMLTIARVDIGLRDLHVKRLERDVDPYISHLIQVILVIGFVTMVLVLICIYFASLILTIPLDWMHRAGNHILSTAGSTKVVSDSVV